MLQARLWPGRAASTPLARWRASRTVFSTCPQPPGLNQWRTNGLLHPAAGLQNPGSKTGWRVIDGTRALTSRLLPTPLRSTASFVRPSREPMAAKPRCHGCRGPKPPQRSVAIRHRFEDAPTESVPMFIERRRMCLRPTGPDPSRAAVLKARVGHAAHLMRWPPTQARSAASSRVGRSRWPIEPANRRANRTGTPRPVRTPAADRFRDRQSGARAAGLPSIPEHRAATRSQDQSKPGLTRFACICLAARLALRDLRCCITSQPESFSANGSSLPGRSSD